MGCIAFSAIGHLYGLAVSGQQLRFDAGWVMPFASNCPGLSTESNGECVILKKSVELECEKLAVTRRKHQPCAPRFNCGRHAATGFAMLGAPTNIAS